MTLSHNNCWIYEKIIALNAKKGLLLELSVI